MAVYATEHKRTSELTGRAALSVLPTSSGRDADIPANILSSSPGAKTSLRGYPIWYHPTGSGSKTDGSVQYESAISAAVTLCKLMDRVLQQEWAPACVWTQKIEAD